MTTVDETHTVIIAYRLEDKYGNSPFYVSCDNRHFPVDVYPDSGQWKYAFMNPCRFLEHGYSNCPKDYFLFEYLLRKTAHVTLSGEVTFRDQDVVCKSIVRR